MRRRRPELAYSYMTWLASSSSGGSAEVDPLTVIKCAGCLVVVFNLALAGMSSNEPSVRSDYGEIDGTCPAPSLFRSSSDVASSFATNPRLFAWKKTVELGRRDADDNFQPSGYKLVDQTCSFLPGRPSFHLLDGDDEVVASVVSIRGLSKMSLEVYDCGANLLATVRKHHLSIGYLALDIKDNSNNLSATIVYDRNLISGDQMNIYGVGDLQDKVLSTITHSHSGHQWSIVMNANGEDVGPGGDERVIAAIATYVIWDQLKRDGFSDVCNFSIVWLEISGAILLSGLGLKTAVYAARHKDWAGPPNRKGVRAVESERRSATHEKLGPGIEWRSHETRLLPSAEPVFCPPQQQTRPADGGPPVLCMVCFDTHCKCPPASAGVGPAGTPRGAAVLCPRCFDIPCAC